MGCHFLLSRDLPNPGTKLMSPESLTSQADSLPAEPLGKHHCAPHISYSESEEQLNSLLMKVKEESEKAGLKLSIQKTKIMASSPITSWQVDRETMETVTDFIFGGSKITVDGDCNYEIKRYLLLGRKSMTNLDGILKSRNITLPAKLCVFQ